MVCSCPDGCNGCEQEKDWYEHRDELRVGQVFECWDGTVVQLLDRVEGDGTKWVVADWNDYGKYWCHEGGTNEPGEFKRRLEQWPIK
jgi:hypothetical protein